MRAIIRMLSEEPKEHRGDEGGSGDAESGRRADCSARPPHHVACGSALRGSTERSTLDPE